MRVIYSAALLTIFCCVALLTGCQKPSHEIDRQAVELGDTWTRRAEAFSSRPGLVLSWDAALLLLVESNPDIQKVVEDRARAKRGIRQVYRNLLPAFDLSAGVDKRVRDLDHLTSGDFNLNLNAYAFLSGLLNLRQDVYAAELTYLRSTLVEEAIRREKTVQLYQLFVASAQLRQARRRLGDWSRLTEGMATIAIDGVSPSARADAVKNQLRVAQGQLEEDLTKLFTQPYRRIELVGNGLPAVDYFRASLPVGDARRTGGLRRKLDAIELVGAQARIEGVRLQYWPDVNIFLTSGTIWSTSNGQTIFFNSREALVSANIRVPIDINGYIGNQLRDARKDLEFLQRDVALREGLLLEEFDNKHKALVLAEEEMAMQERKRRVLLQLISVEGVETLAKRLDQLMQIESELESTIDKRAELNAFFLFFDEDFWARQGVVTRPLVEGQKMALRADSAIIEAR